MTSRLEKSKCVLVLLVFFVVSCTDKEIVTPSTVAPSSTASPPTRTPVPTVVEPGLAYGVPCKPPCWQGLTPGESTRQEASQVLNSLGEGSQVVATTEGDDYFLVFSEASSPYGTASVYGLFEEDTVLRVVGMVEFYYSVETLVESFGAPERLTPIAGSSCPSCEESGPPENAHAGSLHSGIVQFLYPTQGLYFDVLASGEGCICPWMPVILFCYYAPMTMEEAFADNRLADLCITLPGEFAQEDLVEWHGFGGGY